MTPLESRFAKLRQTYRRVAVAMLVIGALLAVADAPILGIGFVAAGFSALLVDQHAKHDERTPWGDK